MFYLAIVINIETFISRLFSDRTLLIDPDYH